MYFHVFLLVLQEILEAELFKDNYFEKDVLIMLRVGALLFLCISFNVGLFTIFWLVSSEHRLPIGTRYTMYGYTCFTDL